MAVGRLVAELTGAPEPVNVCARWRSVLRPWDLPSSPASCASPLPARHMAVFFFSSSLRFLPFSLYLSLSFPLSLFLFFFFLFFFQKIKARKGEGSKEKAQERPVQTTQLVRLCPLLVDSLPSLSPNQSACLLLAQISPSPPSHWWAADPAGAALVVALLWH